MGKKVYYDVKGACEYADVARRTIYNWMLKGVLVDGDRIYLPVRIIDGGTQINVIDLDNYLDALGYGPEEEENDEPTA